MTRFRTVLRSFLTLEVFIVAGVFLFTGCGTPKEVIKWRTEYKDSVRVEVHERLVKDTVSVEIPVEVEKIVTRDTVSRLDNSFARSEAIVSGGFLHHSLESKPQVIYVPVEVPVTDTTTTHTSSAIEQKEETKVEYVEKPLTWLQKTEIYGFRCMVLFALLWFGFKYRKQILALARRFI
ncbi:MAG: hypothetical protein II841_08860 [Bacteroidales bacterium]|nr:hypothetical protein [Bacteroidales bacterium]